MALNPKQARFVSEYLIDFNASAAYQRAGYIARGHSAESNAFVLLRKPEVCSEIARRTKKAADKYELSTDMVVRSIVQELTFDPAKLYDADGDLLKITELPEDIRMALTSVEFEQHGSPDAPVFVRKVKWSQRQAAREQAMKYLGMFLKDNEQKRGVEALTEEALDRLIAQKAKEAGVVMH